MAVVTNNIVVGSNGSVWVAPLDATPPTDVSTAMGTVDSDWVELGAITEAGVNISVATTTQDINIWQSLYVARRMVTQRDFAISFGLREWKSETIVYAFGGGDVDVSGGVAIYSPPGPEELGEQAMVLECQDGDKNFRIYVPKGMPSELGDVTFARSDSAVLQSTFSATPTGEEDPWQLITDDVTAFTEVAS